jgi:peptide/nickel transport system substrate-binding protein
VNRSSDHRPRSARRTRSAARLSWLVAAATLVTAHGAAAGNAPSTTEPPDSTSVDLDPDATLRIVAGSTPNQFDPCGTLNGSELSYMGAIYAPLIRSNQQTGELSPGIATDWAWSDDKLELRLTLRDGLTFQDDTPVNADTVVESLNQCVELGNQNVPGLSAITADGDQVVFTLDAPTSGLPDLLGSRLGMIASPRAREAAGSAFGSQPVGAGPYRFVNFVPGSSIELARWDGYQDAGPRPAAVASIQVSIITDPSAQVAALTGGQADFGYRLDSTAIASLQSSSDVEVFVTAGVSVTDLNIDRTRPPMDDVRVRQAISYAIDRATLADVVTNGLSDAISVQPYPPGHPFHFDDMDERYPFDPDKARELLADAGYADGLELRGVSLDGGTFVDNGVIISEQLAAVGITVTFEAKALPDATKSFYDDHEYDIFSTGMNSGPDWLTIYRRLLATSSAGNAGNVPVEGGDEVLEQLNAAYEEADIVEAIRAANEVYQEQLPIVPLYFSPINLAWSDNVVGAEAAFALNGEADYNSLGIAG